MKKFSLVVKDLLTEQSRSLGKVEAESKEEACQLYGLKKGTRIPRMEYYWWEHFGEMLIFIYEDVDTQIPDQKTLEQGIRKFHTDVY